MPFLLTLAFLASYSLWLAVYSAVGDTPPGYTPWRFVQEGESVRWAIKHNLAALIMATMMPAQRMLYDTWGFFRYTLLNAN